MDAEWEDRVRTAVLASDGAALARLFEQAVVAEGRAGASRSWLSAISAFDADAITG